VYVPRPTPVELRAAGESFPSFTYPYLTIDLPPAPGNEPHDPLTGRPVVGPPLRVQFPQYHVQGRPDRPVVSFPSGAVEARGERILAASAYARTWRLAQTLRAQSTSAYDYVLRVRNRVQLEASYSESPPPSRVPLETFLFDERTGYCQQFSGAMALLLRMGGIPARVASGFSPGRLDRGRDEYVVRDLDAHSWVEAYFPGLGWITFDPTPAIAPARSQVGDDAGGADPEGPRGSGRAGDVPGDVVGGGGAPTTGGGGTDWPVVGAVGLAIVLLLSAAALAAVRRGRLPGGPLAPELAELQRALHRTGRTPAAPTTLTALEEVLGGSDAARGYLRALRDQRFRGAGAGPTAVQRRALRHELAAGLGLRGRLRAWWALPPRPAR
jgi:transglutaminase-like putative cysteine protease